MKRSYEAFDRIGITEYTVIEHKAVFTSAEELLVCFGLIPGQCDRGVV